MATAHFTDNEGNVLSRQGATPVQLEVDTYLTRVMKLRTAHDRNYLVANRFISLDAYVQSHAGGPHISIEIMKRKSDSGLYNSIEDLRADVAQLVKNWKEAYPDKSSDEWKDAERVRKNASEYFSDKNKRRSTINTTAPGDFSSEVGFTQDPFFSTEQDFHPAYPFSSSHQSFDSQPITNSAQVQSVKRKRGRPPLNRQSIDDHMADMSITQPRAGTPVSPNQFSPLFEGKSFQDAQEFIVRELKQKATARDEDEFHHFINLPSRELKDYYEATPNLQSINLLEKKVLGFQGKNQPLTGKSEFGTWDAFLKAATLLWTNATNYNTEDCDVYRAAVRLEPWFMERYKAAKSMVPEPQVRLRLTQPQPQAGNRIRLNLSGPSQANAAGMSVDPDALRRQHQEVAASAVLRPRGTQDYFFSNNGSAQQLPANGQWRDYPAPNDYEGITRFHGYDLIPWLASETYEENLARRNRMNTGIDVPLVEDTSDDWDKFDTQDEIFDAEGPWSVANGGNGGVIPGMDTPMRFKWKRGNAEKFSPIKKMRLVFHNEPYGHAGEWFIYEYFATPEDNFADSAHRFTRAIRKRPQVCKIQVWLNHQAIGNRQVIPHLRCWPCRQEDKAEDFPGHKPHRKYPYRKEGWAFGEAPDILEWDAKPIGWGENEFKVEIFVCPPGDPENDGVAPRMTRGNEREQEVLIMSVKFTKKTGPIEDEETDHEGGQSD